MAIIDSLLELSDEQVLNEAGPGTINVVSENVIDFGIPGSDVWGQGPAVPIYPAWYKVGKLLVNVTKFKPATITTASPTTNYFIPSICASNTLSDYTPTGGVVVLSGEHLLETVWDRADVGVQLWVAAIPRHDYKYMWLRYSLDKGPSYLQLNAWVGVDAEHLSMR